MRNFASHISSSSISSPPVSSPSVASGASSKPLLFRAWDILRLPAILLIIAGHCSPFDLPIFDDPSSLAWQHCRAAIAGYFVYNHVLFQTSMIFFFIAAGFMFFRNGTSLPFHVYRRKLRSRVSTLLIPYLCWNLLGMLGWIVKRRAWQDITDFSSLQSTLMELLSGFVEVDGEVTPFDFPLWFLRNLIVVILFTPMVGYLLRHCKGFTPLILLAISLIPGANWLRIPETLCYFSVGAAWSSLTYGRGYQLPRAISMAAWGVTVITTGVFIFLLCPDYTLSGVIGNAFTMVSRCCIAICAVLTAEWVLGRGVRFTSMSARGVFFLFGVHGLFSSAVRRWVFAHLDISGPTTFLLNWIISFAIVLVASMLLLLLCRRYAPRTYHLLTGESAAARSPLFL